MTDGCRPVGENRPEGQLSTILAGVASAVTAAQGELDGLAREPARTFGLEAVAFLLKQTEASLTGTLSLERLSLPSMRDRALILSQIHRVKAALRGDEGRAFTSSVFISIAAIETP
jgi:hypothetical protein